MIAKKVRTGRPQDNEDFAEKQKRLIGDWCELHIGKRLEVTATKDFSMIQLWDDRAIQVAFNEGNPIYVHKT